MCIYLCIHTYIYTHVKMYICRVGRYHRQPLLENFCVASRHTPAEPAGSKAFSHSFSLTPVCLFSLSLSLSFCSLAEPLPRSHSCNRICACMRDQSHSRSLFVCQRRDTHGGGVSPCSGVNDGGGGGSGRTMVLQSDRHQTNSVCR